MTTYYNQMKYKDNLIFDIDDTILTTEQYQSYETSTPIFKIINKINSLYDKNYYIILYTARGFLSKKRNPIRIEKEVRPILETWLQKHNVKYHELLMHKPYGAIYVDDKAVRPSEFLAMDFE